MGNNHTKIFDGAEYTKIRGSEHNVEKYISSLVFDLEKLNASGSKHYILKWFVDNFPNVSKKDDMYIHLSQPEIMIQNVICVRDEKSALFYFHLYDQKIRKFYSKNIPLIYKHTSK